MTDISKERRAAYREMLDRLMVGRENHGTKPFDIPVAHDDLRGLLDAVDERDRLREEAAYVQAAVEYAETHTRVQSPQTSSQAAGDRYREARDAFRALYTERHNARTE